MDYQKDYIAWLNQCYIKYGCTYQGETIRNKLSCSSKTLYDENGNTHYYKYEEGLFSDNWYIDGKDCCSGCDRWQTRTYYQFLETTRPPKKTRYPRFLIKISSKDPSQGSFLLPNT